MEQRFGRDFSRVRVHTGTTAEQSAHDVMAHAYTLGHDIVFGAGRFAPGTSAGRRLLAHELTHVVQQTSAGETLTGQVQRDDIEMAGSIARSGTSVSFARRVGREDAQRIRRLGVLSTADREAVNGRLHDFTGPAKAAYLEQVRPALVAVTRDHSSTAQPMPALDAGAPFGPAFPTFYGDAPTFRSVSSGIPAPTSGFDAPQDSNLYWWEVEGKPRVLPCPNCHQRDEQPNFASNRQPSKWKPVGKGDLLQWARDRAWQEHQSDRQILSWLQRQQDDKVDALWNRHLEPLVATVRRGYDERNKRTFEGSENAKARWADLLRAEWPSTVLVWLDGLAEDWLVSEIAAAQRLAGRYTTLVTDPAKYAQIEDAPDHEQINIGGAYNDRAGVGFLWLGRQAVSVTKYAMNFQVLEHPRI
jgi:hypothetical protein